MPLLLLRARDHAGRLVASLLIAIVLGGAASAIVTDLESGALAGVRAGFAERSGADLALRIELPLDDDAARQDADVRAMIAAAFADVSVPVRVERMERSTIDVGRAGEPDRRLAALRVDDPALVSVTAGRPAVGDEVLLHEEAAAALGIGVGDTLSIAGTSRAVVGLWRPAERLDPAWLGDPLVESGRVDGTFGPLLLGEPLGPTAREPVTAQWTLIPALEDARVSDLGALETAWFGLESRWTGVDGGVRDLARAGQLVTTVRALEARVAGFRAAEPVALLVVGAGGLVTLVALGRLTARLRERESRLLWARGATPAALGGRAALEAGVALGLGAAVGATLGGVLATLPRADPAGGEAVGAPLVAAIALLVALPGALSAGLAVAATVGAAERAATTARSRATRLAGGGTVLALVAAIVAVGQLRLYGSPVVPTSSGGSLVDPLAVLAPALLLSAAALGALAAVPLLARLAERGDARRPLAPLLAIREIARRPGRVAVPTLLVTVAVASIVLAHGYAATWSATFARDSALRAGAPVAIDAGSPLDAELRDALSAAAGGASVLPVDRRILQFSTGTGEIVSVPLAAWAESVAALPGTLEPAAWARAVDAPEVGIALPDGVAVALEVEASGVETPLEVAIWLRSGPGDLRRVALTAASTPGEATRVYGARLPDDARGSRLVAIDVRFGDAASPDSAAPERSATVSVLRIDGEVVDLSEPWDAVSPVDATPPTPIPGSVGFRAPADADRIRLVADSGLAIVGVPGVDPGAGEGAHPGVVVSEALAADYGVRVGDSLTLGLGDFAPSMLADVVAVVPVVPGSRSDVAALLDLSVLQEARLRTTATPDDPSAVWIATDDPTATAAAARPLLPANARLSFADDVAGRTLLGRTATALLLAAGGAAVLALVGSGTAVGSLRRERRPTVAILRSLGVTPVRQASVAVTEGAIAMATGLVAGVAIGALVVSLTVPALVRGAVPGLSARLDVPVSLDDPALAGSLAVFAAALVVTLATLALGTWRDARSARGAEDER